MRRTKIKKQRFHYLTMLRAFGLLSVSLYHLFSHIFPGGFLGVILFLSMSGFLMAKSYDNVEEIDFKQILTKFYRKINKLVGPLLIIISLSLIFSLIFARDIFDDSIKSSLPVVFSFENIREIIKGASYFDRNGNFNLFTHLWYISIYLQFILIFYVLKFCSQKIKSTNIKIIGLAIFSFLSIGMTYYLSFSGADIIRIYYGTDTRIYAFFMGMICYLLINKYKDRLNFPKNTYRLSIGLLFLLSLVPMFFINGEDIWIYRTFFLVYSLVVTLLIGSLYAYEIEYKISYRDLNIVQCVVEYFGLRSLYMYIWQYIVQIFFTYLLTNVIENKLIFYLLQVLIIIILSELSHLIFDKRKFSKKLLIAPLLIIVLLNGISFAIGNKKEAEMKELKKRFEESQEEIARNNRELQKKKNKKSHKIENKEEKEKENQAEDEVKDQEKDEKKASKKNLHFKEKSYDDLDLTENELDYVKDLSITAVGDSVLINIDKYLRKYVPKLYLDGEVGRDMIQGPEVLEKIKNEVGLGDIILIDLGSNGSAHHKDMQKIMDIADGRDVYFVNTSHLQSYMDKVNEDMADFIKDNPKAHLVDWRNFVKDRPDLLAVDRTHPNVEGSEDFARLVLRKILNVNEIED